MLDPLYYFVPDKYLVNEQHTEYMGEMVGLLSSIASRPLFSATNVFAVL